MKRIIMVFGILFFAINASFSQDTEFKWHPGLYQLSMKAGKISSKDIYPEFRGVQIVYPWNELEPEQGKYDFSSIRSDINALEKLNKMLVIQVQFKSFKPGMKRVPDYISGPEYGGGVYETDKGAFDPVHWNPKVQNRVKALIYELAKEFDENPNVEAINLPECVPGPPKGFERKLKMDYEVKFNKSLPANIERFDLKVYTGVIKSYMRALKDAFHHTVAIQYINWTSVDELMSYAEEISVGVGGPDLLPRHEALRKVAYHFYSKLSGIVPLGTAIQHGNYSPKGQEIDVREIYDFGRNYLKLNYMFWDMNRPPFDKQVLEMIRDRDFPKGVEGGLNPAIPSGLLK